MRTPTIESNRGAEFENLQLPSSGMPLTDGQERTGHVAIDHALSAGNQRRGRSRWVAACCCCETVLPRSSHARIRNLPTNGLLLKSSR